MANGVYMELSSHADILDWLLQYCITANLKKQLAVVRYCHTLALLLFPNRRDHLFIRYHLVIWTV